MPEIKQAEMKKKRGLKKRTRYYAELLQLNERKFYAEWNRRVDGWMSEIRHRIKTWRGETENPETIAEMFAKGEPVGIFDLLETAKKFIAANDRRVRERIEKETVKLLEDECIKAVAVSFNLPTANSFVQHWFYRRAKK